MYLFYLFCLCVVTPFLVLAHYQRTVIFPKLRKELLELNHRRAERIHLALSTASELASPEAEEEPSHPFAGWVELREDGAILVAAKVFRHTEPFQAVARDRHNISRASVTSHGDGNILISSHGQSFIARYGGAAWEVKPITSQPS